MVWWRLQISLLEHPNGSINVTAVRGWWVTGCDVILSIYGTCIPFALHLYCPATRVICGSNEGCINQTGVAVTMATWARGCLK